MMLSTYMPTLQRMRIVLASQSPRRREILEKCGLSFEQIASTFPEDLDKSSFASPAAYVVENARRKAIEIATMEEDEGDAPDGEASEALAPPDPKPVPDIVIGADTVVVVDGHILEKPADAADAHRMLRSLSGRRHQVYTGVAILLGRPAPALPPSEGDDGGDAPTASDRRPGVFRIATFSECTHVSVAELSDEAIAAYVASGEPFDKAGGYGIQGGGAVFISGIEGCYYNVMGFPLHSFCVQLRTLLDGAGGAH